MKKHYISKIIITACCIFLLTYGCKQDPVDYNNKIMEIMNASTNDLDALNAAMEKEDLTNAENVRKAWETKLVSSLDKLKGISDFKGDSSFKNASVQALETYLNIVSKDYKRLIELRGLGDKADSNEINQVLNRINQDFEKAANTLNAASDKFAKEYASQ
ncbi:hypothetical protein E4413_10380 [Leptospira interrogans]|uniref:LIC11966 family lipoprotein n=1 Tax=Leptospira interrogans TaxID=173 RepID=UPI0003792ACC|nr:ErpY-like lipoprotein [Leptospira interrogans]KAA1288192.1 hypothetical protein C4X99_21710 [Leptospira interrogans serovar Geyaweera]QCO37216.1 hypothetical protein E4412_08355 [Leptospira interrogans]QCO41276.1 hypothetical protein E4413_10380 [Leptospira interrogans]ULG93553.1 ErpY-like lipoprotein [Leptospira interrogans]UML77805.1 ErpY-like lipoprotein [Leptospira interrogans]